MTENESGTCGSDTDRSSYPWNVQIDLGGVTFEGPGMESRPEAEAIAEIVERSEPVDGVEVFRQ